MNPIKIHSLDNTLYANDAAVATFKQVGHVKGWDGYPIAACEVRRMDGSLWKTTIGNWGDMMVQMDTAIRYEARQNG